VVAEQSRIVRLPLSRVGSLNKISRSFDELEQKFEREPSADEIAELLDLCGLPTIHWLCPSITYWMVEPSSVLGSIWRAFQSQ
jgi:DNA-directed RNA polymerase specialized sigma subunit